MGHNTKRFVIILDYRKTIVFLNSTQHTIYYMYITLDFICFNDNVLNIELNPVFKCVKTFEEILKLFFFLKFLFNNFTNYA